MQETMTPGHVPIPTQEALQQEFDNLDRFKLEKAKEQDPTIADDIQRAINIVEREGRIRISNVIGEIRAGSTPKVILEQMRSEVQELEEAVEPPRLQLVG